MLRVGQRPRRRACEDRRDDSSPGRSLVVASARRPAVVAPDAVPGLLVFGYRFLPAVRRRSTDGVGTMRVAGRRAVVSAGPEALRALGDGERFAHGDALPGPRPDTLIEPGSANVPTSVPGSLLSFDRVGALADRVDREWSEAVRRWRGVDHIVVFEQAVRVLGCGVLAWAGIRARPGQLDDRARDLASIVDGSGCVGVRRVRAWRARRRCEGWARVAIRHARAGRLPPGVGADSPVALVAAYRDAEGRLLDDRTAAAALLNVLQPAVAAAWQVTFAVAALVERPEWRARLAEGTDAERLAFVDEVRRVYPFVPALVARARRDLRWQGRRLPAGGLFVVDVYGTHTDPAVWRRPRDLDPERFLPGGGADRGALVQPAGSDVTIELTSRAARLFAGLAYRLPPQDLRISLRRMPTGPASGVVLTHVRRR